MRTDLQYDLCPGCGEIKPQGLFPTIMHSCPANTFIYRKTTFTMRMFNELCGGRSPMQSFKDLLHFNYFAAMPDYETVSYMDRFIYSVCRDTDIAAMKRLRAYIELEEEFNAKY